MKEIINDFIQHDVEIHFVRDDDGLDQTWRENLNTYASSNGVVLHHLQKYELESYLLSPNLIYRTIRKKYPQKENIPDAADIEQKLIEFLTQTVSMNKFNYEDNLEDSIYKTGLLLKDSNYRNPREVTKESKRIRKQYEEYENFDDLLVAGMGKEALKLLLSWLGTQGLNISKKDISNSLTKEDIPEEIVTILTQMTSRELPPYPENFAAVPEVEADKAEALSDIPDESEEE